MTMPSKIYALKYSKEIDTCNGKRIVTDTEWLTAPCGDAPAYISADIAEELARALEYLLTGERPVVDSHKAITRYRNAIDTAAPSV